MTDVGPEGADQGYGGKHLFLLWRRVGSRGLHRLPAQDVSIYAGLRPVEVRGGRWKPPWPTPQLKVYQLANASNPGAGRHIDAFPRRDTHRNTTRLFENLHCGLRPNPRKFRQSGFQTSTVWCSPRLVK